MKTLATMLAVLVLTCSTLAEQRRGRARYGDAGTWTLNVGVAIPQGDHKDLGFDSMIMLGGDYSLGPMGPGANGTSYVGLLAIAGQGNGSLHSRTFGVHYGVLLNFGGTRSESALNFRFQGGIYNTRLSDGFEIDETSFGGLIAIVWKPQRRGERGISGELGFYSMPKVGSIDNNGWYIAVGIPLGGR